MKIKETITYNFPKLAIPTDASLNLIGLALSSRRIKHSLPVHIIEDTNLFVDKLDKNISTRCGEALNELWEVADKIGLDYPQVTAAVHILEREYKITFCCYGE